MRTVSFKGQLQTLVLGISATVAAVSSLAADEPAPQKTNEPAPPTPTVLHKDAAYAMRAYVNLAVNQLGIEIVPVEDALKSQLGIEGGLVITKAPEQSEGAKAGLQAHDVILNINGPRSEPVRDIEKLNAVLTENAGKKIEIGLLRAGKMQLVGVTVPQRQELLVPTVVSGDVYTLTLSERYRVGVALAEADDTLRSQLQLPAGEGVVVTEVIAGTPAEKNGLKSHDILVELDGKRLGNVEEVNKQVQEVKSKAVTIKFLRSGKLESVELTPEKVTEPNPAWVTGSQQLMFGTTVQPIDAQFYQSQFIPNVTTFSYTEVPSRFKDVTNDPRAQIATLKQQLGEMQKAIAALEASLPAVEAKLAPTADQEKK